VRARGLTTSFDLVRGDERLGRLELGVPGRLNAQNAAGAAALALELGAPFGAIRDGLAGFAGVGRRFEVVPAGGDVLVVDDYAHHPAEVRATLKAAREGWDRRVVALFQPHLYSRTRDLAREFGQALALADLVFVTDVYAAREAPLPGVDGALVADAARAAGHPAVSYVSDLSSLAASALERIRPGDLVLVMGAGDVGEAAREIAARLARVAEPTLAPREAVEEPVRAPA
jgi:UDP-N-acetylmuramate--alanine ligase